MSPWMFWGSVFGKLCWYNRRQCSSSSETKTQRPPKASNATPNPPIPANSSAYVNLAFISSFDSSSFGDDIDSDDDGGGGGNVNCVVLVTVRCRSTWMRASISGGSLAR